MITAMNETTVALVVLAVLAASGFAAYLVSVIKGDGLNLRGHEPPASHHRDLFDPSSGPTRLA